MKNKILNINWIFFLLVLLMATSCKEDYYQIDDKFYDGMQIVVKNELVDGTLRIEQYNSDKILIEEATNDKLIFDSKAFIYNVEHDSIVKIQPDGTIVPQSIGKSQVEIIFRANGNLKTTLTIEVYKDYHAVDYLMASSAVGSLLVEKDFTVNLATYIFVFPAHADNKKLHFSLDESSKAFASITDEGVITGITPGEINVHITSDENPAVTLDVTLKVVTEIAITDLVVHPKLNNITIGLNEIIQLNKLVTVLPSNVNEINRQLLFNVKSGSSVVTVDLFTGVLRAIGGGEAVIEAISKNDIVKEFTVIVDPEKTDLTRTFWTVNTSILYGTGLNYVVDGTTGKPEDMFDNNGATFLSLVKPGKTYNGATAPDGIYPYFIVDMQSKVKFNTLRWNHRSGNAYTYLRVWAINFEGSLDGENWEEIKDGIELPKTKDAPNANDNDRHDISLDDTYEYRYVKVIITNWSDNSGGAASGSTIQIGEFGLANK